MTVIETPAVRCLQCGESRTAVKLERLICGIVEGYESPELVHEWAHHRWTDWHDAELERFGLTPEAYDRHRRLGADDFQWVACRDTLRGHAYVETSEDLELMGVKRGQCFLCGRLAEAS